LLVGHYVSAEASCYLKQEPELPKLWFDTFVEELKFYSGLKNHRFGLIDCCNRYNIETISHVVKDQKRKVVMDNYPNYTEAEKAEILEYNLSDVEVNEKLFLAILKKAEQEKVDYKTFISQAIFHGRSKALCAKIYQNGIPINLKFHNDLETYYPDVRKAEMEELNKNLGIELYVDYKKKQSAFEELLKRENLYNNWPKTETGKCKSDDKTFYRFQDVNEKIKLIRNAAFIIDAKKLKGVCLGKDGRSRTDLKMFGQITGRTNVSTKESPFGAPRRMRNLIGTDENHYLIYCDWRSQEAVIQAQLSQDPKMLEAVGSGDAYMYTAIKVGAAPPGAKKKTHKKEREIYKQCFLALAYLQTAIGLKAKIKKTTSEAFYIHDQVTKLYRKYFEWIFGVIRESTLRGYFKTVYGWRFNLTSNETVNKRTLANWPLQSHGSEILRVAIIKLDELGFEISMPVHDAVLLHMKRKKFKDMRSEIKLVQKVMADSAAQVIGKKIPVDVKIIRDQYYQDDDNQYLWDDLYSKILKFKQRDRNTDSLSDIHSAPSVNQSTVYYS
jgi:DNA polymerase-1